MEIRKGMKIKVKYTTKDYTNLYEGEDKEVVRILEIARVNPKTYTIQEYYENGNRSLGYYMYKQMMQDRLNSMYEVLEVTE